MFMRIKQAACFPLFQAGFTLIEIIISMVVISISVSGVLMAINFTVSHSADPVIQHQSITVAESYLDEIMLQSYATMANSGGRATYNDISDYNGLTDTGVKNQYGTAISGLENYNVSISVTSTTITGIAMKQVNVSVTGPDGTAISISAYNKSTVTCHIYRACSVIMSTIKYILP